MFIDSPGFADIVTENYEQIQEVGQALLLAQNDIHAIVLMGQQSLPRLIKVW